MKKSRVFILLAVFFCLVTALCVTAGAATVGGSCGADGSNVKWSLDTDTGELVISGTGKMADYDLDNEAPWSKNCSLIQTVAIENDVTSIGDWAFCNCSSLTSVTIPDSVTRIGTRAFYECTLLTSITISKSVVSIGEAVFGCCTALESIEVDKDNPAYTSDENSVLYNKDMTALLVCPAGIMLEKYAIPSGVKSIDFGAFGWCRSLQSIIIPDSVTSIGSCAFTGCGSLTSIAIPDSVTRIDKYAFASCSSLTSITIPDSVTSIDEWAFTGCSSLTSITIPSSVTSIDRTSFLDCPNLTIYGYTDSYAETYAAENSIPFVALTQLTLVSKTAAVYKNNTAAVRFIVKLSLAENAVVENYGILLAQTAEQARVKAVILTDAFEGSVTTYAVDLVGIPQKDFDTEIYAWAFVKLVGVEEKIVLPISAVTVNSVLTEMGA